MKSRMLQIALIGFALVVGIVPLTNALAATVTTTLPVSLTITAGACEVQATSINFGNVPSAADVTGTGTITVTCSSGTPYTVTLDGGLHAGNTHRFLASNAGGSVAYDLYKDAANTQVWGDSGFASTYPNGTAVVGTGNSSGQPLTVFGKTLSSTANVPGTYTDTIVVTVIF
ncbi:spore coat U domain-containing protein [Nitrospira sp. BLG_1]|uniref:Csu type fimbrial protein n=1 Tax=Nitrospira sp. BLG_1 TaxID=3395883 RepID=UPI0039BCE789